MSRIAVSPALSFRQQLFEKLTAGLVSSERVGAIHYLIAAALVGMAALVRLMIAPATAGIPFLTFFPAATLAAILAGIGPGIFATLLSVLLASILFMPPFFTFSFAINREIIFADGIFLFEQLLVCASIQVMRKYHRKYVHALVELGLVTQAENRVARVAELLRRTGELGRIGGWHLELDTMKLTCSDEMFLISGLPLSHSLSFQEFMEFYSPEALPGIRSAVADALENASSWDIEAPYRTARGQLLWVRSQGAAISEMGRVVALSGAVQDITERKQIELALRASEQEYRALAESMPQIVWTAGPTGNAAYFNQHWYDYTGMSREESIDFGWNRVIHPDDLGATWSAWRTSIISGGDFSAECRLRRFDGAYHWWLIRSTALRSAADTRVKWFGTFTDIEDMKQSEQELRIAATAFESQEGMLIADVEGIILKVNRAFSDITGYQPEEIIGKTPRVLQSGYHDQDFYAALWRYVARHGMWQGEVFNRRKNGEIYPNWLTIAMVRDKQGEVTHYIGRLADISARKAVEEKIKNIMFIDPLTQLPNLRNWQGSLRSALQESMRTGMVGAIMLIDIDNFKAFNNARGHDIGDQLLLEFGSRLQGCLRTGDMVARLGSDQFLMSLVNLHQGMDEAIAASEIIAHQLRGLLNQPYVIGDNSYNVTASMGVTLFSGMTLTVDDLLKLVELALVRAKAGGRNMLCVFDPKMHEFVIAQEKLIEDLHHVLSREQLELHFQIQSDQQRQCVGAEALIRWRHPELGLVPPGKFIPLAEESGLIIAIGQWVLETACAHIKRWEISGLVKSLPVAVNVSARQFRQPEFVENVTLALHKSGVNPASLKLELTESSVLEDIDDTICKMCALKEIGVTFSLDDFGTGYSSLAYLSRLPLNQLKIDQSFVRNIGVQHSDGVIVQTIIGMANNLGMEVIAEGVETEEQRAFLERHGCSVCQGYLFGKPLPLAEFENLLRQAAVQERRE